MKMSVWSLACRQAHFSDITVKTISQFYPQDGGESQLASKLRHCHPLLCGLTMLWRCCLGGRKGIRPVKTEWLGAGVVICLERGADLQMAQLIPLPLTVSCFSKIQVGFTFLVLADPGSPGQRAVKRVCVCHPMYKAYVESGSPEDSSGKGRSLAFTIASCWTTSRVAGALCVQVSWSQHNDKLTPRRSWWCSSWTARLASSCSRRWITASGGAKQLQTSSGVLAGGPLWQVAQLGRALIWPS